jgi:cytochrome c556
MEAIGAVVQSRGDQRQLVARVDQMIAFYRALPERVPAASLTPPLPQGTQDGPTRAIAAIDANRAGFGERNQAMLVALSTLRGAAEAGTIGPDMLRSTGGTCGACHQAFRAR